MAAFVKLFSNGCTDSFQCFVVAIYAGVFGVALVLTEIRAPMCCTQYMGFTMTFLGRGLAYIFLGCLIYLPSAVNGFCYAAFIVMEIIGFLYVILGLLGTYGGMGDGIGTMQPMTGASAGNTRV